MINIFSQILNKNGTDFIYDCSIDDNDITCFTHGLSYGKSNMSNVSSMSEILSTLNIDFPSLREIMISEEENIEIKNYIVKKNPEYIRIYSKINSNSILLPKKFLKDSYDILKNMWIEDEKTEN